MSIFFDTNSDGTTNFQYEYTSGSFFYKENQPGSYVTLPDPAGYSRITLDQRVFTFTIPKSEFGSTFRLAVNGTQNNNPVTGTHVQVGIPVANIFANGFFTSQDYLEITP